jgi:aryl sulfotransferase
MTATSQRRIYRDGPTDGTRWERFTHRPGDIVIATPAKCGTTWMQTIVASLLFPDGSAPGPVVIISPWVDGRLEPIEAVAKRLDRQEHRRFVKTHTPADGVPFWPSASYIVVLRDGRDAFMSAMNHMAKIRPEVVERVNAEAAAEGGRLMIQIRDPHEALPQWLDSDDFVGTYLASWWSLRGEPNVLLVHYDDLKADLDDEMRRIASFLGIEVPPELWPDVVERCTFASMKARPDQIGPFDLVFEGGVDSFLYKGTSGRWRDVLTEDELALYARRVADHLPPDALEWLERGAVASGRRP